MIYFDSGDYYIQDLGVGFGTFMKITEKTELHTGDIISICDTHLVVNTLHEMEKGPTISLSKIGSKEDSESSFTA